MVPIPSGTCVNKRRSSITGLKIQGARDVGSRGTTLFARPDESSAEVAHLLAFACLEAIQMTVSLRSNGSGSITHERVHREAGRSDLHHLRLAGPRIPGTNLNRREHHGLHLQTASLWIVEVKVVSAHRPERSLAPCTFHSPGECARDVEIE